jgi:acyl carrier protein
MKDARGIHRAMNLELDLGFSSLERVEFLFNVQEAFGIQIPEEQAAEIFTVQDLLGAVEQKLSAGVTGAGEALASWTELLKAPLDASDEQMIRETLARRPVVELMYFLVTKLVRVLCWLLFRLKFKGQENLPKDQPFLICPNHLKRPALPDLPQSPQLSGSVLAVRRTSLPRHPAAVLSRPQRPFQRSDHIVRRKARQSHPGEP